jgi:signal transduction histidine kinase
LVEQLREVLLERWAGALGVTEPADLARLAATLDSLVEVLNAPGNAPQSGTKAPRLAELAELRARVIEIADERGRSLKASESVALHRAIDELIVHEASRAGPTTSQPESAGATSFHDRFLALLGHDLRNPISAVKLATSILARDTQSPEARRRTLQRVTSNTDRLLRMLEDSLDYSRLYQGRELAIEATTVDVDATSRTVLAALEAAYPTRSFVYESSGTVESTLDKDRFIRLLSNLLVAAVEHAAPDSETRFKLERGDVAQITIECPGVELTESELEHLFDSPLGEPRDKTRRSRGFGVGLFVGERAIAQQGGSLRGEALAPTGIAFVITLPAGN